MKSNKVNDETEPNPRSRQSDLNPPVDPPVDSPHDPYALPAGLSINAVDEVNTQEVSWIAPSVDIWGDVRLTKEVSIWFQSVLRGDVNFIEIGTRTNIQDGTIIHVSNQHPCRVGAEVTVGHRALLHACTIEDLVLVGMGATVLTGAVIGRGSVIAAGAVVKENENIPPFTLMAGVPARKIRSLEPETTLSAHQRWAEKYVRLATAYKNKQGT